mmetsp:Transcript_2380/g.4560  ORF Transcript_2380/g.4560 Transcript_2380/m.4560 type:complete len:85 (-) Transcript_2380:91-345(-)
MGRSKGRRNRARRRRPKGGRRTARLSWGYRRKTGSTMRSIVPRVGEIEDHSLQVIAFLNNVQRRLATLVTLMTYPGFRRSRTAL